jgi:hypothetical protein
MTHVESLPTRYVTLHHQTWKVDAGNDNWVDGA